MSFDLQEALNGAPVKLNNGRKAFMLYDLRKYPSLLRATGRLPINGIMLGNNEDDGDHVTWDEFGKAENSYLSISGMWEEPELTSEQVLEKAYQEDLKVSLDGQDVYIIIGKAKDGSYLLGSEKSDSYIAWSVDFGNPEICQEDTAELSQKSDTITVTLPKPFRPKGGNAFYFISDLGEVLVAHFVPSYISHVMAKDTGRCFRKYDDAKAWLDAMKNALDD
mgnify:CR=1 FL=1